MAQAKVSQSRTARWLRAVDQGRQAHEKLQGIIDEVNEDLAEAFQTLVDGLQEAIDTASNKIGPAADEASEALEQLRELQEEYQEWYDNMPQQLQDGPTGEKLMEISNFDFDVEVNQEIEFPQIDQPSVEIDLSDLESILDEAEAAELPLGFGRD